MSAAKALFPEPIVSVAVNGLGQDEAVAVLGSSGKLYLLRSVEDDLWEETLEVRHDDHTVFLRQVDPADKQR